LSKEKGQKDNDQQNTVKKKASKYTI